jgi:peptidoglycan/xylan/chitin deacetylase (PgdA/CDA1 family)
VRVASPARLRTWLVAGSILALAACGAGSQHTTPAATTSAATQTRPAVQAAPPVLRLPAQLPNRVVQVPILMYHRIDALTSRLPPITRRLTVDPRDFGAQLGWLAGHGFHTISPQQLYDALMKGTPLPPRPVLLTFDDGYRDVLAKAVPRLRRYHMTAIEFVITGRISGPDPSFLTWGQLHRLEQSGVAIGSHTVTHRELTRLSAAEALSELRSARSDLERHLGHPVQWFAYPAGRENPAVVALTREAGYVLAMTTLPGVDQRAAAPLELRRLEILDSTGVRGLASLLGSAAR